MTLPNRVAILMGDGDSDGGEGGHWRWNEPAGQCASTSLNQVHRLVRSGEVDCART